MSGEDLSFDAVIVGSGAGGLAAAVVAQHWGLRVVVLEKTSLFGGTTAWSGGWMWIPRNPLARAAGLHESVQAPWRYVQQALGAQWDNPWTAPRLRAFFAQGPRMIEFFQQHTALRFLDGNAIPDFHGHLPDAGTGGRSVVAAPFDGRRLGANWALLKPPLVETTLWGMGIAAGLELRQFLRSRHELSAFTVVARRLLRHLWDRLRWRRGTRLVNGQALVAALAHTLLRQGGELRLSHHVQSLVMEAGRVVGVVCQTPSGPVTLRAKRGVVLACGGFPHDPQRLAALVAHVPHGREHWSAGARSNTGDGLRLGESAGGQVANDLHQALALAPVSLVPRAAGVNHDEGAPEGIAHFPHLIERAKPGVIAVTAHGLRFTNEANAYHDVMQDLLAVTPAGAVPEAWLVCDHRFIRYFGLGAVKPAPLPLRPWLRNGYLKSGATISALAQACGIDPEALAQTIARYNTAVAMGVDTEFGKGNSAYNRLQGDVERAAFLGSRNPCMAALTQGPFYAVKIVMGSLGSFAGLRTNAHGQVLRAHGRARDPQAEVSNATSQVIPGLYANGNDMSSVMGGHYPAGGITLGPAMTFGWIIAHHLAERALPEDDEISNLGDC